MTIAVVLIVVTIAALTAIGYGLPYVLRKPRASTDVHTVMCDDGWRIKLFRYRPKEDGGEPVLLAHGAFSNHHNWDTPPGSCLIDVLTEAGYDCWAIDFRGCRTAIPAPGKRRGDAALDDYVMQDIPAALDYIRVRTGFARVHWVGHSMGGMLLYAYDCVHGPDWIASGTTLGSPPGFARFRMRRHAALLALGSVARSLLEAYARLGLIVAYGLRLKQNYAPIHWQNLHPEISVARMIHLVDIMPARVAAELESWAIHNVWRMNKGTVDINAGLRHLRVPLFAIFAKTDPFVSADTAIEFFEGIPHRDKKMQFLSKEAGCVEDYNHVDLALSREGRREVFEPILDWIKSHPIDEMVRIEEEDGEEFEVIYKRSVKPKSPPKPRPKLKAEPEPPAAITALDSIEEEETGSSDLPVEISEKFRSVLADAGAALNALLDDEAKPAIKPAVASAKKKKPTAKRKTKASSGNRKTRGTK